MKRSDGFSLIEMMVVLAIVALAIAVAMPAMKRSAPAQKLESEARTVAALMRYGRTLAITKNREVDVEIDLKRRRIGIEGVSDAVVLSEMTALRVMTARGQIVSDRADVMFTPQGGSSGGSVTLSEGKIAATVAISWLTAEVNLTIENAK